MLSVVLWPPQPDVRKEGSKLRPHSASQCTCVCHSLVLLWGPILGQPCPRKDKAMFSVLNPLLQALGIRANWVPNNVSPESFVNRCSCSALHMLLVIVCGLLHFLSLNSFAFVHLLNGSNSRRTACFSMISRIQLRGRGMQQSVSIVSRFHVSQSFLN